MSSIPETARALHELRATRELVDDLPATAKPADLPAGYAVQDALVALSGGTRIGYKIGATNKAAQELLAVEEPFFGQLLSGSVYPSDTTVSIGSARVGIEPEFAYTMARDVISPARAYTGDSIAEFVADLIPSIELVWAPFRNWAAVGAPTLAAANAAQEAWIHGPPAPNGAAQELDSITVRGYVDGQLETEGGAAAVLGHPLNALAWLANRLLDQGRPLGRGDYVTTGVCTQVFFAEAGQTVTADFGPFGSVSLSLDA